MGTCTRALAILAIAAITSAATAATITLTYGVDGYTAASDTSVMSYRPDLDASGIASLTIANWRLDNGRHRDVRSQALIAFDLADVLPANAVVQSATLSLFVTRATPDAELGVFDMDRAWRAEDTWNTLGAPVVPDSSRPPLDRQPVGGHSQRKRFVDFDVTASVDAWARGLSNNYGWAVATRGRNVALVQSMEATANQRPKLSINFETVPEPATLALLATAGLLFGWRRD